MKNLEEKAFHNEQVTMKLEDVEKLLQAVKDWDDGIYGAESVMNSVPPQVFYNALEAYSKELHDQLKPL